MYRIVASDMDETFLGSDHGIPEANVRAVGRLREEGVLFVPASGRSYESVLQSLEPIRDLLEGSYLISYNGGCVNRIGDERPLASHTLPFETAERVFRHGLSLDVGLHVYTLAGKCWGFRLQPEEVDYLRGHMDFEEHGDDISFLRDEPISKVLYVRPGGLDYLHEVEAGLGGVAAGTSTTFSSGRYLEFNPVGVDKGSGLRDLAGRLGVDLADVVACGDSANDASMLRAAGVGVAVSNATADVLSVADYLALSSCDDGVIAEVEERVVRPSLAPNSHHEAMN